MGDAKQQKITRYFSRRYFVTATQEKCDAFAAKLVGYPVKPTDEQGLCSYTVLAGSKQDKVVQFREETLNFINAERIEQAWLIHGDMVPRCTSEGVVGELKVCLMTKITGDTYSEVCYKEQGVLPSKALQRLRATTKDLARFFAESWTAGKRGQQQNEKAMKQRAFMYKEIDQFTDSLPIRFKPLLQKIRHEMYRMFVEDYPYVLTHLDLLPWNVLVDKNGHITGIIDWWDAKIMPFGVAIQGLHFILLGWMDKEKWIFNYYNDHEKTEQLFWTTFEGIAGGLTPKERKAMEVAQMVGYFLRYGSTWDESLGETGDYRPTRDGEEKMVYLDALVKWSTTKSFSFWRDDNDPTSLLDALVLAA